MSDFKLMLHQTVYGLKGLYRNPQAVVFTLVMPVAMLLLFNSIFTGQDLPGFFFDGQVDVATYFTPGIIAYSVMLTGFSTLLINTTTNRERGLIKRARGTPMPPWVFITALILQSVVVILLMVSFLIAVGWIVYGVQVRTETLPGLIVFLLVGTASMCALGLAATRVANTAEAATAMGPFTTVILGFLSGVFIPRTQLPDWIADLGKVFPLSHLARGLQDAFSPVTKGNGIDGGDLLVLGLWGLFGLVVAVTTFRWEPQGTKS